MDLLGDDRRLVSFPPIIDDRCDKIILGSMPGAESLRVQQYYAHPRNQFWRIMYASLGEEPEQNYERRVSFLLSQGIALWDVLSHCVRQGSLDANIREEEPNDFYTLFNRYPSIRQVYFNGGKAYDSFRKLVVPGLDTAGIAGFSLHKLPSTSPAHTIPFESKLAAWSVTIFDM